MAGVLAQLKVIIGANISQLKSGLDEAAVKSELTGKKISGTFNNMGRTFARAIGPLSATGREVSFALQGIGDSAAVAERSLTAFGTAAAVAGGIATGGLLALTGLTVKLFHQIDQQADLAKGLGLTTSEYVKLTSAMKLYGIQQEQITPGLSQFSKIVSGLMRSKAGAEAISEIGLSMKQLRLMDTHQQLLAVADAFSKFPDGPRKSAIAAQLFTATLGAKMIPLLDQGAAGVEKLEAKYKDLADESQKLADTTKNLSIQWEHASSVLAASALKAAVFVKIPGYMLAIAHPLFTLKAILLDWASTFDGVLATIDRGGQKIEGFYNALASHMHMPQMHLGFGSNARFLSGLSQEYAAMRDNVLHQINSSGETPLKGGGSLSGGNMGGQPNKVAAFLTSLKQQIAEFGKGDVAKGIDKLKELGATQAQLAQGKGLLAQLDYLKQKSAFQKSFTKAQESFSKLVDKLKIPQTTMAQWKGLEGTLHGIVSSLRESGADALGLKVNTWQSQLRAGADLAAAGPIGGRYAKGGYLIPGFTPSGFGKMRFDFDKLNSAAKSFGQTMSESFTRMLETGQGFHQLLQSLLRELETFAIQQALFKTLGSSLGKKGGFLGVIGNFLGGLSAPGRAVGGPVSAGSLYRVGENGPEWFAPGIAGQIIPSTTAMHKSNTMVYSPTFHINTPNADSFRKSQSQILSEGYRHMAATHARNA